MIVWEQFDHLNKDIILEVLEEGKHGSLMKFSIMPFSKNLVLGMPFPCKFLMYQFHCIHPQTGADHFFLYPFHLHSTHQQHHIICADYRFLLHKCNVIHVIMCVEY